MDNVSGILVTVAAVVCIIVGGVWLSKNVSAGCVDLGFYKSCGVVTR